MLLTALFFAGWMFGGASIVADHPLSQNTAIRSQNCNCSSRNTAGDVKHITLSFHSWDWGLSVSQLTFKLSVCLKKKKHLLNRRIIWNPPNAASFRHRNWGGGSGNISKNDNPTSRIWTSLSSPLLSLFTQLLLSVSVCTITKCMNAFEDRLSESVLHYPHRSSMTLCREFSPRLWV